VRLGENGDENSVIYCYFYQRFHAVLLRMIGEKVSKSVRFRIKTNRSRKVKKKYENAGVIENTSLCFLPNENGDF